MEMHEEDIIICTVNRIESNTVFVRLEDGKEATLIISEIAPGRIKNLREYVVPNKKIVCKILRVQGEHIDLSLRRVSSKEKKEFLEKYNYEHNLESAFKQALKEKAEEVLNLIKNSYESIRSFVEKAKLSPELLEKTIPQKYLEAIKKIINKKQKEIEVKKSIKIKCLANDGVSRIKSIFCTKDPNIKITYLAAGMFQIKAKAEDYKQANQKLDSFINEIEAKSKKENCEFNVLFE